ncbi:MAG: hypothetical protein PHN56_00810 [Candidatus Nanoarchaeia archaeon]|nr:hypothetical protein [Candidatus Nanoarchaeia archaeon]
MIDVTTIQLEKKVVEELKKIKEYPNQSYNEIIEKITKYYKELKKRNTYDEFLHKIQQPKMKELWDNKNDEEWEDA